MKIYFQVLGNTLVTTLTTNVVWFTVFYWAYLQTQSVIATSIMSGLYIVFVALSGFWLGSIVDHNKKKQVMLVSTISALLLFAVGGGIYATAPAGALTTVESVHFWAFLIVMMFGMLATNVRSIALSTLTTIMVPIEKRDKMNGLVGTVFGISFMGASIISGFALAFAGMTWVLIISGAVILAAIIHLSFLSITETVVVGTEAQPKTLDIKGTIAVIKAIPGLFALIFFTTFNNFLGGVFMPLMDAYGLSLVPLPVWGTIWGVLGSGFIIGGIYISKKGLGKNPLKTLFRVNIVLWIVCMFMAIQPSIILLSVCLFLWMCLVPFVEATEQTIVQKVVPLERQGRVFGFAQSIEQAASPLTAFMIGPIAQFIFIPFMTNGSGVELIGHWYGTGPGRGIGLLFTIAGIIGLIVTLVAMRSRVYKLLSLRYQE